MISDLPDPTPRDLRRDESNVERMREFLARNAQHTDAPVMNSTHFIWSLKPAQAQHTPNLAMLVKNAGGEYFKRDYEVLVRIERNFTHWHLAPILSKTLWLCFVLNVLVGVARWFNT